MADIQSTPGFERFLRPPDPALIRRAASSVPLVYLGATEHGGFALMVPDVSQPVIDVDLPDLTTRAVQEVAEPYEAARAQISPYRPIRPWLDTLDLTLPRLWELAMERLCGVLEDRGLTRAVLIAYGGNLAALPWHAAWTKEAGRQDDRRYACDSIAWRYAPNATLSGEPRLWPPRRGEAKEVVVVHYLEGISDPKQDTAPIRAAMGKVTLLTGRKAAPEMVRRTWHGARYVHLDTHAEANPDEPLKSCLLLAEKQELSIGDLLRAPQPLEARLMVLASCGSAVTSGRQGVDEIVSFPAALMRAGAAQVMASAWPVWNEATVQLIAGFYERLGQNEGTDLAESLLASAEALRSGGSAQFAANRLADRRAPFWSWLRGRPISSSAPKTSRRWRASYRLKVAPDDTGTSQPALEQDAEAASPEPDPDTAPSNWNHPYFWAGFAIHGTADQLTA